MNRLLLLGGLILAEGCYLQEGVCADSGDRMGSDILGPNGADYARCDLACPDGALLGSREGMWAVSCWPGTCQSDTLPEGGSTFCAYEEDVRSWRDAYCPECQYRDWVPTDRVDQECEIPFRHVWLDCQMKP